MDIKSPEERSRNMSQIRSTDTKPEVYLRRKLFAAGFRYRKNDRRIEGCPDIWLPKYRTAIFVHGCFWHRHEGCRYAYKPKSRTDFWEAKFRRNVERDTEVREALEADGVNVLTVWECTIRKMVKDPQVENETMRKLKEDILRGKKMDEQKIEIDKIGERYVAEHFPELFEYQHILQCRYNMEYPELPPAEGADLELWSAYKRIAMSQQDLEDAGLNGFSSEQNERDLSSIIKGPAEVKTARYEQYAAWRRFLKRGEENEENHGRLSFAIWNAYKGEKKRSRIGSLRRMFWPEDSNHERFPISYITVFLKQDGCTPYVCLAFERFRALKYRLIEIGYSVGLDLSKEGFEQIPCWNNGGNPDIWAKEKMKSNPNLILKGQMWYVRMEDVIDLATVTMIGDLPEINKAVNNCSTRLQQKRLDFLIEHSHGRVASLNQTKEIQDEIALRKGLLEIVANSPFPKKIKKYGLKDC